MTAGGASPSSFAQALWITTEAFFARNRKILERRADTRMSLAADADCTRLVATWSRMLQASPTADVPAGPRARPVIPSGPFACGVCARDSIAPHWRARAMSQNPFAHDAGARPTLAKAARHCPYPKTRGARSGPAWSASAVRGRRVLLGAARRDTGVAALFLDDRMGDRRRSQEGGDSH